MSVYREALTSGRLDGFWSPVYLPAPPRRGGGTRQSLHGVRRALREAKRAEADERAAQTPHERTREHRRQVDTAPARLAGKVAGHA